DYVRFMHWFECSVAPEAACKRSQRWKLEAPQHFDGLLERVLRSQVVAVADDPVHEKAAIAGEKGAVLSSGEFKELSIFAYGVVEDIDAKQAQVADELPKMTIRHKLL